MPKAAALADAKRWLRDLSADEALQLTAAATNSVVRGNRGKGEKLEFTVPAADPQQPPTMDRRPFAHPRYWSAATGPPLCLSAIQTEVGALTLFVPAGTLGMSANDSPAAAITNLWVYWGAHNPVS